MSGDFQKYKVVDIASTSSPLAITTNNVFASGGRLFAIYVNTVLSNHVLYVKSVRTDRSPTTTETVFTIPAQAAAGTMYKFDGIEFRGTLAIVSSNATATGNITVIYKTGTAAALGVQPQ